MTDDLHIQRNPAYAGLQPRLLDPACHDRSPMLDVRCSCGADSHLHESQLKGIDKRARLGIRCSGCEAPMMIEVKALRGAFAHMRREGWSR